MLESPSIMDKDTPPEISLHDHTSGNFSMVKSVDI